MPTPRSKAHARFGAAAKAIREDKEMTQTEVAQGMGVPATFLSDIERGVRNPSLSTLLALSKALGVKLSKIFERAE
jgi:transcriptional regulator with XRE-family HTH domain